MNSNKKPLKYFSHYFSMHPYYRVEVFSDGRKNVDFFMSNERMSQLCAKNLGFESQHPANIVKQLQLQQSSRNSRSSQKYKSPIKATTKIIISLRPWSMVTLLI